MEPRYHYGQRVRIVSVEDQRSMPKYPNIERYVSETGMIVEYYWTGLEGSSMPRDYYTYLVRLERDGSEVVIPEDALEQRIV